MNQALKNRKLLQLYESKPMNLYPVVVLNRYSAPASSQNNTTDNAQSTMKQRSQSLSQISYRENCKLFPDNNNLDDEEQVETCSQATKSLSSCKSAYKDKENCHLFSDNNNLDDEEQVKTCSQATKSLPSCKSAYKAVTSASSNSNKSSSLKQERVICIPQKPKIISNVIVREKRSVALELNEPDVTNSLNQGAPLDFSFSKILPSILPKKSFNELTASPLLQNQTTEVAPAGIVSDFQDCDPQDYIDDYGDDELHQDNLLPPATLNLPNNNRNLSTCNTPRSISSKVIHKKRCGAENTAKKYDNGESEDEMEQLNNQTQNRNRKNPSNSVNGSNNLPINPAVPPYRRQNNRQNLSQVEIHFENENAENGKLNTRLLHLKKLLNSLF